MLPTEPPSLDAAGMRVLGPDRGDVATFDLSLDRGVVLGFDGDTCRMYIEAEGSFLLMTLQGIGPYRERDLRHAELTVWTSTGAFYEGWGDYNVEGWWPEPPTTIRCTATVMSVDDPADTRSIACEWVRPIGGHDTVIVNLE